MDYFMSAVGSTPFELQYVVYEPQFTTLATDNEFSTHLPSGKLPYIYIFN